MAEGTDMPEPAYRNHPFRLAWQGRHVAGISKVSALAPTTRSLTLERGITHDDAFVRWVNTALEPWSPASDGGRRCSIGSLEDIVLEMYDEAGRKALGYNLYRCWPSACELLPGLDSKGDTVAFSMLRLEYEGCEPDAAVQPSG